jgi:hypothetical protein
VAQSNGGAEMANGAASLPTFRAGWSPTDKRDRIAFSALLHSPDVV